MWKLSTCWWFAGWTKIETVDSLVRKAGYMGPLTESMRCKFRITRYQSSLCTMHYSEYAAYVKHIRGSAPLLTVKCWWQFRLCHIKMFQQTLFFPSSNKRVQRRGCLLRWVVSKSLLQIACDFLQATWSFSNWWIGHLVESCLTGHWCQDRCFDVLVLKNHSLHHLKYLPIMLVFSILDKKCWGHCPNAWFILTSINILSFLDTLLALRHVLLFPCWFCQCSAVHAFLVWVILLLFSLSSSTFSFIGTCDVQKNVFRLQDTPVILHSLYPSPCTSLCVRLWCVSCCIMGMDTNYEIMRLWDYCFVSSWSSLFALH